MNISEERLRELVLRVLRELQAEEGREKTPLYMVCMADWSTAYEAFLHEMETCDSYRIYPVVPDAWKQDGCAARLAACPACAGLRYRSEPLPPDLEQAVSLFPVVPRDLAVKTALCISDTFETAWVAACIEAGSRTVFLRSGLARFSGKETPAYVSRILTYYRQLLEYGIEIGTPQTLDTDADRTEPTVFASVPVPHAEDPPVRPDMRMGGKKRVITASNVERLASGKVLHLLPDDIVTDLARDRAKFLNIRLE